MITIKGGQKAKGGTYVGVRDGEWVTVPKDGGILPGTAREQFLKMPLAAIAAPFLGLAYLIFLPFVGFVMGGGLMVWKIGSSLKNIGRQPVRAPEPEAEDR